VEFEGNADGNGSDGGGEAGAPLPFSATRLAQVMCEATDLAKVRQGLASGGFPAAVAELVWVPKDHSDLLPGSDAAKQFEDLLSVLDDNADVQQVFHNARYPEE
jgi:transcriptional/translational regulatory protein YebC/TACO1